MTQDQTETATVERVQTTVTTLADLGHPCCIEIIDLTMKTVLFESSADGRRSK